MAANNLNTSSAGLPVLRPYQVGVGRAVLESIKDNLGLLFTVEIARQGGKNELSAQLELLLLVLNMEKGGNIIKCSPTFKPQSLISLMRLWEKIKQAGLLKLCRRSQGHILSLGQAKAIFYSAEPFSHVMGATAHLLLEVDEAQDVDREKFSRDFKPMASSTNATTVLYGTTWDESSLLEEAKQRNLEMEKADGIKRHFRYDWEEVAKYNQAYRKYVQLEKERLGENHPIFLTQYRLLPLSNQNRFFSSLQLAQLRGAHARLHSRVSGKIYVAGLDLAGLANSEIDRDRDRDREGRGHDAGVLIIAELESRVVSPESRVSSQLSAIRPLTPEPYYLNPDSCPLLPSVKLVEIVSWKDEPYTSLYGRLLSIIKEVWNCSIVVVDATGVGAGIASYLKEALGRRIIPFQFTAQSKSKLGFQLLSFINLGKIKIFSGDGSLEIQEFWKEMEKARVAYRANQTMNFYVEISEGHDDYLMSLALAVEAAALYRPRKAIGMKD